MIEPINIFSRQFLQNLQTECKSRLIPTKSILQALKHATSLNNQYKQQISQLNEQLQQSKQQNIMLSDMLDQLRSQNEQYRQIKEKRWKLMNDKQTHLLIQNETLKNVNQVLVKQVQLLKKKIKNILTQDKQNSFDCSVDGELSLFQSAKFNNYVNFQDKQHSTNQNTKVRISLEDSQTQKQSQAGPHLKNITEVGHQLKNIFNCDILFNQNMEQMVQLKKICSSQQIIVDSPRFIKKQTKQRKNVKKDYQEKEQMAQQNNYKLEIQKRRNSKQYTFYKIQTNKSIQEDSRHFINIDDKSSIVKNHNIISDYSQSYDQQKTSQLESNIYINVDEQGLLNDIYNNTASQQFYKPNNNTLEKQTKMRKTTSAVLTSQQAKQIQQTAKKQKNLKNNNQKITKKQVNLYPAINSYNQTQSYKTIIFTKDKSPLKNQKSQSIKTIQNNVNPLQNKSKETNSSGLRESILKSTVMSKSTTIINKHKELMASKLRSKQKKNTYANIHGRKVNQQPDSQERKNSSKKSLTKSNQAQEAPPVLTYNQDQYFNQE